ncbi:MAG: hypothetical protein CML23_23410 [Rhizobiaceae bacterium]|nr:hypothetical protein [Rhizobiaceae bacterium]
MMFAFPDLDGRWQDSRQGKRPHWRMMPFFNPIAPTDPFGPAAKNMDHCGRMDYSPAWIFPMAGGFLPRAFSH